MCLSFIDSSIISLVLPREVGTSDHDLQVQTYQIPNKKQIGVLQTPPPPQSSLVVAGIVLCC